MPNLNMPGIGPNGNFSGIGDFTSALMGGGAAQQRGYEQGMSAVEKVAKAKRAAEEFAAFQSIDDAKVGAMLGITPEQAAPFTSALRANGMKIEDLQRIYTLQRHQGAYNKALLPDSGFSAVNAELAGLENGVIPMSRIEDGNLVTNPYAATPTITPTQQGLARIAADEALVGQRMASAAASNARAGAVGQPKPSPVQVRQGTLEDDIAAIEGELGRPLTGPERAQWLTTGKIGFKSDSGGKPAAASPGATMANAATPPKSDVDISAPLQALKDARRAIATGRISKEEARKRLYSAGYKNVAGRL